MIRTKSTGKSVRDQLLEKAYLKRVNSVAEHYRFDEKVMGILMRYEEVIDRLELVALNLDTILPDEELYTLSVYMNGIFVYEYDFTTEGMVDAVPESLTGVEVYEVLLNDKLAILALKDRVLLNRLEPGFQLVERLKENVIWNQLIGSV